MVMMVITAIHGGMCYTHVIESRRRFWKQGESEMEQLLALRLADLTRPINVGIISPIDKNPVLVAAWKGGSIILSKKEVKLLC